MVVKGGSFNHQRYRSRVKGVVGDRSNVSQRWVKYQSEIGPMVVRGWSNIHQIQVKSEGCRWR